MSVLAVDAGTTGVTALVIASDGTVSSRGYAEFRQYYPQPGWVEHQPDDIWQAALAACAQAVAGPGRRAAGDDPVTCIGIASQRETAVLWDRSSLAAPRPAIVWQDRRTAGICGRLGDQGHQERVRELTGLALDPYFTATKLTWLAGAEPGLWDAVAGGSVAVGTVDSYLIARLTGGRRHVTDASNASRTLLFDIRAGQWSDELCELFGVPRRALPEVVPSWGVIASTDPASFPGPPLPIAGVAGDQQAALFGQACFAPGAAKCTYGTGSFLLSNAGTTVAAAPDGLLSTVAWMDPSGTLTYALEGSVFVTGAAVQWLRDGLGILGDAAQSEALAASVPDSGGVVFVPALTGLGAPYWDPDVRGAMFGLTRGTTRAHLARAVLEAITFEVRDVAELMARHTGAGVLRVDGGAAGNSLLMQLQASQLQAPVERPVAGETTALGAAFLAGLGTGAWSSAAELASLWQLDHRFEPGPRDDDAYTRWREAVQHSRSWARASR